MSDLEHASLHENMELCQRILDLQNTVDDQARQLVEARRDALNARHANADLGREVGARRQDAVEYDRRLERTRADLAAATQRNGFLEQTIDECTKRLDMLQDEARRLRTENCELACFRSKMELTMVEQERKIIEHENECADNGVTSRWSEEKVYCDLWNNTVRWLWQK